MTSTRASGPRRAGFSVAELLVVIAIIVVLTAILLPVLASARRAARSTACLATLHQWGGAFQMYLAANRGRAFAFVERQGPRRNPPLWWEDLEPYHPEVDRTLLCPEATEPADFDPADAFEAWGPLHLWPEPGRTRMSYAGSYGVNAWLYRQIDRSGRVVTSPGRIRLPSRRADRVPVIFDSARIDAAPRDTDSLDFNPDDPIVRDNGNTMRRVALWRHGRGTNVVFADGHAAPVTVPDLWTLQWSEDFKPRTVTLPD